MARPSTGWKRSATNSTEPDASHLKGENNAEAQTRQEQPRSVGHRPGLHGNEFFLRPAQGQEGDDLAAPRGGRHSGSGSVGGKPGTILARAGHELVRLRHSLEVGRHSEVGY